MGDHAGHSEHHGQQGRRGRVGIVPAVRCHRARDRQRGRVLHRRDGRVEPRRRGRRRHDVSRSLRVRGKQLPGREQSGRVAARRPRVQHGDQDRHESISRRRDVQRREQGYGLRQLQRPAGSRSAGDRAALGAGGQPGTQAGCRHPLHLGYGLLVRRPD